MKEIQLTKGYVTLVDDADYDWLNQWDWWALVSTKRLVYAQRRAFNHENYPTSHIRMPRLILGVTDRRLIVDHINNNGLDNRRSNLRICTHAENMRNSPKKPRRSSSGIVSMYKGVTWGGSAWIARISINYKTKYIGRFDSEYEAAAAYNDAAKIYFGEFAQSNNFIL